MGRVRVLFRATRLSRRRGMKLRSPRTADMLFYSWLAVVVFVRFTQNSLLALRELTRGSYEAGLAITEFNMLHLLLVTFLLPFLISTLSLGATSLSRTRLALSSTPLRALFLSELAELALSPLTGVVVLFLVPAVIPILALSVPAPSVISLCAGFMGALLAASAAGQALSSSRGARSIASAFRFIFVAVMIGLALANFDFQWKDGAIQLFVFQKGTLLRDSAGRGLLSMLSPWSPSAWIMRGWLLPSISLAAFFLLAYAAALRAAYRGQGYASVPEMRSPHAAGPPSRPSQRTASIRSLLFRNELRHLILRLGSLAGFSAALGFSVWLLSDTQPLAAIAILGCFAIHLTGFAYPTNRFGNDGNAIRRYALAGVSWADVFFSKDRAWLCVIGASFLPVIAADAARVSAASALSLGLACAVTITLTICWGVVSSMLFPSARQGSRPPFANQAAPFALWGVVLAVHRAVSPWATLGFDFAMLVLLAGSLTLYAVVLRRVSRTFDAELEAVLERLRAA